MMSDMLLAGDFKQNFNSIECKKVVLKYFTCFGDIVAPYLLEQSI
jgi:hypothetical protein